MSDRNTMGRSRYSAQELLAEARQMLDGAADALESLRRDSATAEQIREWFKQHPDSESLRGSSVGPTAELLLEALERTCDGASLETVISAVLVLQTRMVERMNQHLVDLRLRRKGV